ncbi:MAG: hypothetical protein K2N80_17120 [Lachnospiraceae bacterium]|nr:hypothetical protein [Lachnospiraceae bacterium]
MMKYTQAQLEECLKKAYSYENRDGWEAEELETEFIGTVQRKRKLYDIYVDTERNYWYEVRFITDAGIVSEYEAVFGCTERKRRKRRQGA